MRISRYLIAGGKIVALFVVVAVAAIYYELCPRFHCDFVSAVLFHPWKSLPGPNPLNEINGIKGEEIRFCAAGSPAKMLDGWLYRNKRASKVVLLSHGNAGLAALRAGKAQSLLKTGQSVFLYDYEGFGKSDGSATPANVVDDACAAYDLLIDKYHYQPEQIVGYGESLGTGVTAELMRRRTLGAIILESGFTSTENLGKEKIAYLRMYPSFLWFEPSLNVIDAVRGNHPPLLIIHGRNDETIPWHHAQQLYEAASEPKQLIMLEHSGHNSQVNDLAQYETILNRFLNNLMAAGV